MNNKHYFLALNRMSMVGPRTVKKLLQRWPDLDDLFSLSSDSRIRAGLSSRLAHAIAHYDQQKVEMDWRWEEAPDRSLITWEDPIYPALLKEIYDPPPVLYAEGALDCLLSPMIGMVGTRHPTIMGTETAWQFSFELATHGLSVVSGLARGIDAAVHEGSLAATGKTIAVMGTGIDCIYPRQHAKLADKIKQQGLILSEFPLKTPPNAGHFPRRNRIISGLSLAILVVEAAIKSGSLLTARLALEQNRDVFAIPGSIHNPQVMGCHHLLQQGAKLVTTVKDVLDEIQMGWIEQQKIQKAGPILACQQDLLQYIGYELATVDQLVARSERPVEQIICDLAELELEGMVQSVPGGYKRCRL
jgi:DNA processing protein